MSLRILGWLTAFTVFAATSPSEIRVGDPLPELKGQFLSGRTAVLPQAASGRAALLMLGFTYDSRLPVEAWTKRFRADFGNEPRVTFFEIPMIGGMARLGKWFIDSGMRRGTPKADHENVITVYGGTDAWKQRVGFKDEKAAYLILLDAKGHVAWRHAGSLEEGSYKALTTEVSRILAAKY
jgi:hypothetical protein